jgi:antitoxin HigA-1
VKRTANKLAPIHPGEILREEFMLPRNLSQNALARALNVPPRRINEIVLEKRGITADTILRLARYKKQKQIERDVEPLAALEPAMA